MKIRNASYILFFALFYFVIQAVTSHAYEFYLNEAILVLNRSIRVKHGREIEIC